MKRPDGSGWHALPARDTVAPLAAGPGPVVRDAVPATASESDQAVREVAGRRA